MNELFLSLTQKPDNICDFPDNLYFSQKKTMQIGAKIKSLREAKGITQKEMEDILEVSHGTYCNWESGVHEVKVSKLPKIAETLQISIQELFEDKKNDRIEINQRFKESTINGAVVVLTDKESAQQLVQVLREKI